MDLEELYEFEEFSDSLKYAINNAPNSYYKDIVGEILSEVQEEITNAEQTMSLEKKKELKQMEKEYWDSQF